MALSSPCSTNSRLFLPPLLVIAVEGLTDLYPPDKLPTNRRAHTYFTGLCKKSEG